MVRSRKYWEENDYYSSDEDTFTDRTGQVERKRLERIRQLGVTGQTAEEAAAQVASLETDDRMKQKPSDSKLSDSSMLKVASSSLVLVFVFLGPHNKLNSVKNGHPSDKYFILVNYSRQFTSAQKKNVQVE